MGINEFIGKVHPGDCREVMSRIPKDSVDLIFADPPYNLQLNQELWRPDMSKVDAVDDSWDEFDSFQEYDAFTEGWLRGCRRILKPTGSLWVIGSYHNIYRVGKLLQDLGFWILNDVVWIKTNPMPNFRGVRFTNAHETLLWVSKEQGSSYAFNHHAMKAFNDGKQMRSDWSFPVCSGAERIRINGEKVHSAQKPEALLYRVILASSQVGDIVLDPFFGTGTTGVVAKKLHRKWIGIEQEENYVRVARQRIEAVEPEPLDELVFNVQDRRRNAPRVPFIRLIETGYLQPGQELFFREDIEQSARIRPDGKLLLGSYEGSIHQVGRHLMQGSPCNGWEHWYFLDQEGEMHPLDALRKRYRREVLSDPH